VAGPILYLLVMERGAAFGSKAATLSLFAILASEAFSFAYAWTCRSRSWPITLIVALMTWLGAAFLLSLMPTSPTWAICMALAAVLFGQTFLPRGSVTVAGKALTRGDLIGRMGAGAALTLAVTSLSPILGPQWSGLLAVFPLLGSVLSVSSHRAYGPDFVIGLLRGMVLGRFSFAAFCLYLIFALPTQSPAIAFAVAAVLAIGVQGCTKLLAGSLRPKNQLSPVASPAAD
jgi:hypothetical protein